MASRIDFNRRSRLLAAIPLLALAHQGMAADSISVDKGVAPAAKTPISASTSKPIGPQLSADLWCANHPCLRAAEPDVSGAEDADSDLRLMIKAAKELVTDELIDQGVEAGVKGFQGLKVVNKIYGWKQDPVFVTLEGVGLLGKAASAGLSAFFESSEIGEETPTDEVMKWHADWQRKNAHPESDAPTETTAVVLKRGGGSSGSEMFKNAIDQAEQDEKDRPAREARARSEQAKAQAEEAARLASEPRVATDRAQKPDNGIGLGDVVRALGGAASAYAKSKENSGAAQRNKCGGTGPLPSNYRCGGGGGPTVN